MLVDDKNQQLQMEPRDWNMIMPAYLRQYLFLSKNTDPLEVVFIMFESVQHPYKPEVKVPVRYISADSGEARAIMNDGSNVPEATEDDIKAAEKWADENTRKAEKNAAQKASKHVSTPAIAYLDTLGRTFLTLADNGLDESGDVLWPYVHQRLGGGPAHDMVFVLQGLDEGEEHCLVL